MEARMIQGMSVLNMGADELVEMLHDQQLNTNPLLEFQNNGLGGLEFDPTAGLVDDAVDTDEWLDTNNGTADHHVDDELTAGVDSSEWEADTPSNVTDGFADLAVQVNHDGQAIVRGLPNRLMPRIDRGFAVREFRAFRSMSGVDEEFVEQMQQHLNEVVRLDLAIKSRFQTMKRVAQAAADFQADFFQHGPTALKPLTKEQLAEQLGLADSTVCRAVRGKLLRTERFGVVSLEALFPACRVDAAKQPHLESDVFAVVRKVVKAENANRPLSDSQLAEQMERHGMRFERKTVSRLRTKLNIPSSTQRRQWHAAGGFKQAV